ncbi:hypothetical protein MRX96_047747 [Rhipicephalus microplus]
MAFKLSFFMQVLLSWSATLPLNLVNTEACPFRIVPQPTRPVFESVNAVTREKFWPFPPILDSHRYLVWQPQATISAADLSARLQKPSSLRSQLGQDTAASMAFKLSFLMQDGYVPRAFCIRSNDPFLLAVSCPTEVLDFCRKNVYESLFEYCATCHLIGLLLILSGDVEMNPGPPKTLESLAEKASCLELTQSTIRDELASIRLALANIENLVGNLSSRLDVVEKKFDINQCKSPPPSPKLLLFLLR